MRASEIGLLNARAAGWLLAIFLVLFCWGYFALDYSDGAFAGTYKPSDSSWKVVLAKDHSFYEEIGSGPTTVPARGTWRRLGEARIVFSREFIPLPGQEVYRDGQSYGQIERTFGLFISMHLDPQEGGPVLRKRLFR